MEKAPDTIAELLYGPYNEKLGYLDKLGISFIESKEILSEITNYYNLGLREFINYNRKITVLIDKFILETDWNNFNFFRILKFDIDDISGIASGYIFRIFRLMYKEHIWCSHIEDDDSQAKILRKSGIFVQSYRAHLKDLLDSLWELFFKYYTGSIDASNVLTINDDAFLSSEVKKFKNFNILLLKYCISNLWINIARYSKKSKFQNRVVVTFGDHIYNNPRLRWNSENEDFKNNLINSFLLHIDYLNMKMDFINHWIESDYYKILDKEFQKFYNFSYSTFHRSLKILVMQMIFEMKFPPDYGNIYNKNVKFTSITWNKKLGFADYFIKSFKQAGFSDENIKELERFINDNRVKFENLKNLEILKYNVFNGAFLETDDPEVITILLEFLYNAYLSNDLKLNFFNESQKNNMTLKLGKVFEKKYCEYVMKTIKNDEVIDNDRLIFIKNNPNVELKEILNLKLNDSLETDVFFYSKDTDIIYVVEVKNVIRKDYTWQGIDVVLSLEEFNGWKDKIKKRVQAVKKNLEILKKYFPNISTSTKVRGVIVISKPIFNTLHFWKDEEENEYFLCLPLTLQYIEVMGKINEDRSFKNNDFKKWSAVSFKKELEKIKKNM